ncbi:MAG: guanylate kinase [Culturomica sp.]|jgi:guanylate kinase|nr:guanylate kinase [Culturomica sp.]
MEKVIIFSAPSGSGKSSIINNLLNGKLPLEFSISATSRKPRGEEQDGKEYYFFSREEFKQRIADDEFLEWEEVYAGCFYGTLKTELERIWMKEKVVLFDVDVIGGLNIKKIFGDKALAIFVEPPSIEVLRARLNKRATDTTEKIEERIAKAEFELGFAKEFDVIIVNENLSLAQKEAEQLIKKFIED